jgi:hypothetical protein
LIDTLLIGGKGTIGSGLRTYLPQLDEAYRVTSVDLRVRKIRRPIQTRIAMPSNLTLRLTMPSYTTPSKVANSSSTL